MKFSFNFSFSFVSRGVAGEVGDVDRGSSRFDDVSMLCNFFFIHIFFVYLYICSVDGVREISLSREWMDKRGNNETEGEGNSKRKKRRKKPKLKS